MRLAVPDKHHLIRLAEAMESGRYMTASAISNRVMGGGTFFARMQKPGTGCSLKSYVAFLNWFSANWPAGVDWPADIPRPDVKKDDAA